MKVNNLRCEYRNNPLGIGVHQPRFSWQLESERRAAGQNAYQITASLFPDRGIGDGSEGEFLWDSGKVDTDQSIHVPYAGPALRSRQRVEWRVRIWDEKDQPSKWSAYAWFETGLLEQDDWQAEWIGNPFVGGQRSSVPCPFFRKEFEIRGNITSARLYITSLGIYEASLNGQRVGQDIFTPGWTDYGKRVQYQTYDVTGLLIEGTNAIGAALGDGWYCGHIGWEGRQIYGDRPKLLAQLEIIFSDGSVQVLITDSSWQTTTGPILESDLLMGEAYDARLEFLDWDRPGFQISDSWIPTLTFDHPKSMLLVAQNTPTVQTHEELKPISKPSIIRGWPHNNWIFDFGQNLVGRVRLKVKGERGTTIRLRFGEMLDKDGKLYTENLRSARQTDSYTLKGDPDGEVWESQFTFHGFQFTELSGLPGEPDSETLTTIVLHSEHPASIEFECSDSLINQLQHNIKWGWKGNSVDIPTDCPQRDERLGWTGDAQVFARTATYLTDSAGFFSKWIQDLADAQLEYGGIPSVAPAPPQLSKSDGGAAWSDATIIVPWTVWQQYGDTRILDTHYDTMCRYMDYLVVNSPDLIRLLPAEKELGAENEAGFGGYGDWLAQDGGSDTRGLTPKDIIGTAFLAYDARLMSMIAASLDKPQDAIRFSQLFEDTRAAFNKRFLTTDGLLIGQTQTAYILALHFDLVPEKLRPAVSAALVKDIEVLRKRHMSTGFVGTPYICQVLTDIGRMDLAYALLQQKSFPSWLYSVVNGATTIWERWDGWTEEKGFHDPGMNSFNHYAYGAVGTWMYENMAGICNDPQSPGFKNIILKPRPGGGISYVRAVYQSPYGKIKSHWRLEDNQFSWHITVPPNSSAAAFFPVSQDSRVLENGININKLPYVKVLVHEPDSMVVQIPAGCYQFSVSHPTIVGSLTKSR